MLKKERKLYLLARKFKGSNNVNVKKNNNKIKKKIKKNKKTIFVGQPIQRQSLI